MEITNRDLTRRVLTALNPNKILSEDQLDKRISIVQKMWPSKEKQAESQKEKVVTQAQAALDEKIEQTPLPDNFNLTYLNNIEDKDEFLKFVDKIYDSYPRINSSSENAVEVYEIINKAVDLYQNKFVRIPYTSEPLNSGNFDKLFELKKELKNKLSKNPFFAEKISKELEEKKAVEDQALQRKKALEDELQQRKKDEAQRVKVEAQRKKDEARRKNDELQQRKKDEAQRVKVEAQRKKDELQQRKKDEAQRVKDEAQRKKDEAQRVTDEVLQRKKDEEQRTLQIKKEVKYRSQLKKAQIDNPLDRIRERTRRQRRAPLSKIPPPMSEFTMSGAPISTEQIAQGTPTEPKRQRARSVKKPTVQFQGGEPTRKIRLFKGK
jgi:hypothetical protein